VDGTGSVRKKSTTGDNVGRRDDGKEAIISAPGTGITPDEPYATIFVYNCVNFFAPASISRAWPTE
jgi:hypothetical protein